MQQDSVKVEGVWCDFVFKLVPSSDLPEILENLRPNFYEDEPICRILGLDDERKQDLDNLVRECMEDNLNLILYERDSNKIAAVQLIQINSVEEIVGKYKRVIISPKTKLAIECLERIINTNIFEIFKVSTFADLKITSVSKEFRGRGITQELYKRSLVLLKEKQFPLVTAGFSNPYTRKAGERLGFKELNRIYFKDFTDENNICRFPNTPTPDDCLSLTALKLND